MNVLRQRPILTTVVVLLFLFLLAAAAATWYRAHASRPSPASTTQATEDGGIQLSSLTVALTAHRQANGFNYTVSIAVQGARTFSMPIRFFRGMKPVTVEPDEAAKLADIWIKARATGIAQFGTVDPVQGPYLLIDVDSPGSH